MATPGRPYVPVAVDASANAIRLGSLAAASLAPTEPRGACARVVEELVAVAPNAKRDADCEASFASFLERHGLCAAKPPAMHFLVATVPDPLDSRLSAVFDQALNALVLAAEKQGSLTDYWLPWLADRNANRDSRLGLSVDMDGATGARKVRPHDGRCHEAWPGLIAFSKDDKLDAQDDTILLLAGELPTLGVRKDVLRRALRLAGPLSRQSQVNVVGPQFSGSAASLRAALKSEIEAAAPGRLDVHVVSGSATRLFNQSLLTAVLPRGSISYEATVIPDSAVQSSFYQYLVDNGFSSPPGGCLLSNVAVLAEADTAYAQSFVSGPGPKNESCYRPKYVIDFPIHISDVRSAWESEASLREQTAQSSVLNVPITSVRVDLHERPDTLDDLPTFSTLTAASDERALSAALGMLQENRVDVVGIVATDSRDKLFLAHAVHRTAPDAQLFLFESDELFTHPDYADVLRGTLVVGTYPLVTSNQFWAGRTELGQVQERTQFDLNVAEGAYNAALIALGHSDKLYEYHWPLMPGLDIATLDRGRPPIWVTAVGEHAFWPVAVLPYRTALVDGVSTPYLHEDNHPHEMESLQRPSLEPGRASSALFIFLCLFIIAVGSAFLQMMRTGSATDVPAPLRPLLLVAMPAAAIPIWRPESMARRRFLAVAGTVSAFGLFLILTAWLGSLAVAPLVVRSKLGAHLSGWIDDNLPWQLARLVAATFACTICTLALAGIAQRARATEQAAVSPPMRRRVRRVAQAALYGMGGFAAAVGALVAAAAALPTQFADTVDVTGLVGVTGGWGAVAGAIAILLCALPDSIRRRAGTIAVAPTAASGSWARFGASLQNSLQRPTWLPISVAWAIGLLSLADLLYSSPSSDLSGIFRYWRAVHLSSELSPVVPTLALLVVAILIIANALRILDLDQGMASCDVLRIDPSEQARSGVGPRLCEPWRLGSGFSDFADVLRHPGDLGYWCRTALMAAVLVLPAAWVVVKVRGRIDHFWGTYTLPSAMGVAVLFCLVGVWHLWRLWATLRKWLEHLARQPIRDAFKRIHMLTTRLVGRGTRMIPPDEEAVAELRRTLATVSSRYAPAQGGSEWAAVRSALDLLWNNASGPATPGSGTEALEDVAALRFTFQIAYAVARLRGIWLCVTVSALLFIVSISTYPVHPHKAILVIGWAVVGAVITATIPVFVQMNRNELLSLLSNTNPNEVTWDADLVEKLIWFAALPLFGLVTAQFPEVARFVSRLLDPILRGTH
jgi:hypothetical protein